MYNEGQHSAIEVELSERSDTGSMNLVFVRLENKYKQDDEFFDSREVETDFQSIKESYDNSQKIIEQLQERVLDFKKKLAEIEKGVLLPFFKKERIITENEEENSPESVKNLADQIFLDLEGEIKKGKPIKSEMLRMALQIIKSGYFYKKSRIKQLREEILSLEDNFRKIREKMINDSRSDVAEDSDMVSNGDVVDKMAILRARWKKKDNG